jgi:hypothetical protein
MAREDWPVGALTAAIKAGQSATGALKAFRESGGRVRTQTWYRLYGQLQLEGATASKELASPLNRRPTADEIQEVTSRRARGYMQRVTIMGRDENGLVIARDVSLRVDALVSRQAAIDKALALVREGMEDEETRDRYPLKSIIGGVYQGTYLFVPEEGP